MRIRTQKSVFVFDLDDTLYPESDYRDSGVNEVLRWIKLIYGHDLGLSSTIIVENYPNDWLEFCCDKFGLNSGTKESLLWIYRLHLPKISLTTDVSQLLFELNQSSIVAILTDGRSITQRQKLKALNLGHLPAYISEEFNSEKPELLRFEKIMADYPGEHYWYIGDNPIKDFFAPNRLHWSTVGLRTNVKKIHWADLKQVPAEYLPKFWIDKLGDLEGLTE